MARLIVKSPYIKCSVSYVHMIAKQLTKQFDVCGFCAACTCRGKLEVRFCKLHIFYALVVYNVLLEISFVYGHIIK